MKAILERAANTIEPRPRRRTLDWSRQHVFTSDGKPYSHSAYPHLGAPGGPFDAFDCPSYLTIWLQFGSRLGKTFCGQCCQLATADMRPCPMMFASADQKLAVEVTDRTYRMLAHCEPLADQLRPEHRRRQDLIDLAFCRVFVGWARSTSTLADKAVRVGHANEIDKWEHQSTSKEADPLKLFSDRFKEFPTHKKIFESTPALKQTSRVERGRLASTNCQYWVPCPHCGKYQTLRMGKDGEPGGLSWQKNEAGKSDKDLARRTAHYVCAHCKGKILDEHLGQMMRAGVWVPEGCGVDDAKAKEAAAAWVQADRQPWKGWSVSSWITGTPLRDGRDAGYQLSSLYALSLTWGDIAAEFVDCQKNPQNLRNFVNQWLAETWEVRGEQMGWEKLAARLIIDVPRFVVPNGFNLLTLGGDVQADHIVYVVDAWGDGRRSHTVDYGELPTLEDLFERVLLRSYAHQDGGEPLYIALSLIDSGFHPRDVYRFCANAAKRVKIWPCKGSSEPLGVPYKEARLGDNTLAPGAPIIHVDTLTTQDWLTHQLRLIHYESDGAHTIFKATAAQHQDFLEQLTNEACVAKVVATTNQVKEAWERIDQNIPNDPRDCRRYAFAAMLRHTRGGPVRGRVKPRAIVRNDDEPAKKPAVQFLERPGGWVPRR